MVERKKEGFFVDIGGVPVDLASGMLDAVAHPRSGFASQHTYISSDVAQRFRHNHARPAYQSWNERVQRIKTALVEPLSASILAPQQERLALPIAFLHSIQWDILGAAMENEYLPDGHSVFFFLELLTVYEAGRIPCGWVGEWPEGHLLVH